MVKRLRRIHAELSLLRTIPKDVAPVLEDESSPTKKYTDFMEPRMRKELKISLERELDVITRVKNDHESKRRTLSAAIADVQQRLSKSKGQRHTQLQGTLTQLRSKQRLMNIETDACNSLQRQLLLACHSRYLRAQKLYKDIKSIDAQSAQLISSRWIQLSVPASFVDIATDEDRSGSKDKILKTNEDCFTEVKKTHLTASIEQLLSAAIAATTPRCYRPPDRVDSSFTS